MRRFRSFDGTNLAFQEEGEGFPVVLLHGFASDTDRDWRQTGLWPALVASGHRVIGLDARGHGRSDKPYREGAYAGDAMMRDVAALFDYLALEQADLAGYSMGASTALRFALADSRLRRLVLGGTSGRNIREPAGPEPSERRRILAAALLADDPASIADASGRGLRRFVDDTGGDRRALAALQLAANRFGQPGDVSSIHLPTLVICGDRDVSPEVLASAMPHARAEVVPGDHSSAIGAAEFIAAVLAFLA